MDSVVIVSEGLVTAWCGEFRPSYCSRANQIGASVTQGSGIKERDHSDDVFLKLSWTTEYFTYARIKGRALNFLFFVSHFGPQATPVFAAHFDR